MTSQGAKNARRVGGLVIGLSLLAGFAPSAFAQPPAPPPPPADAATTATVGGGGGGAPVIECSWALNDADHNWTNLMTYGQDDDPTAKPAVPPCQHSGAVATQADGVGGAPIHISVRPNAHDEPTQAYVELWGAVTSTVASPIVYWDVYHPGNAPGTVGGPVAPGPGTFKVQVDGTRYANSANLGNCGGPQGGAMFANAIATGQMTTQARDNIQNECRFQQKSLWYGAFAISKHQPYGTYTIVMHAANPNGGEDLLTFYIDVLSFYKLEKDFASVDFGPVSANQHFWQLTQGDFTWQGTDNAANQATSVRNTGNAGIGLDVRFASMCRTESASCTDDKRIDHFDVKYGKVLSALQSLGDTLANTPAGSPTPGQPGLWSDLNSSAKPAPFGPWFSFDNNIARVLCPNDVAKIEFSIFTENIQSGTYSASPGIGLRARPTAICPTDLGNPYNFTGGTPTSNTHHGSF